MCVPFYKIKVCVCVLLLTKQTGYVCVHICIYIVCTYCYVQSRCVCVCFSYLYKQDVVCTCMVFVVDAFVSSPFNYIQTYTSTCRIIVYQNICLLVVSVVYRVSKNVVGVLSLKHAHLLWKIA